VPTGVPLRDVQDQLFETAERILLSAGPNGLTSRAVTDRAGVAKGVLHRHFADFDGFLAEFTLDRIARLDDQAAALRASAGTGTVTGNLVAALTDIFGSVALALMGLVMSRDELRARLRAAGAGRVPVAVQATAMIGAYLRAERDLGRVTAGADVDAIAPTLIGTGHLLFAGRDGAGPTDAEVRRAVSTVMASSLPAGGAD
jgi:AcrR family transcriptional regulator